MIDQLEAIYNPEGDIHVAIEDRVFGRESIEKFGLSSEPYAALTFGSVKIYPQRQHIEQLAAALNAYLDAKTRCACGHRAHPDGPCGAVVVAHNGTRSAECPCLGYIGG